MSVGSKEELGRIADALERHARLQDQRRMDATHARAIALYAKAPRQLSFVSIAAAIPGLLAQYDKTVPAKRVQHASDRRSAVVHCACDRSVTLVAARSYACDCGRHLLYDTKTVRCARPGDQDG